MLGIENVSMKFSTTMLSSYCRFRLSLWINIRLVVNRLKIVLDVLVIGLYWLLNVYIVVELLSVLSR